MDLSTLGLDISTLNDTAHKMRGDVRSIMKTSINDVLPYLKKHTRVQHAKDLIWFKENPILVPYDPDLSSGTGKEVGKITKRTVTLDAGMLNVVDTVERYRDTYLATLEDLKVSEKKLPFPKWYVPTITQVAMQDLAEIVFRGEKTSANTPQAITDGLLHIIDDEVSAGTIAPGEGNQYELSGAASDYTNSTIGDELQNQFALFPEKIQNKGVEIWIPYRYKAMYKEWYKTEYPNITDGDVPTEYLDGTDKKAKFRWSPNMGTSKKVIMTMPKFLNALTDMNNLSVGKLIMYHPNGNPYYIGATAKILMAFDFQTLDSDVFNVNDL